MSHLAMECSCVDTIMYFCCKKEKRTTLKKCVYSISILIYCTYIISHDDQSRIKYIIISSVVLLGPTSTKVSSDRRHGHVK